MTLAEAGTTYLIDPHDRDRGGLAGALSRALQLTDSGFRPGRGSAKQLLTPSQPLNRARHRRTQLL